MNGNIAIPLADATEVAAIVAAVTGLIGVVVGGVNLAVTLLRERPTITVFFLEWAADRRGNERYVDVVATNVGRRPTTVVSMGLRLETGDRSWRISDGRAEPRLPARLEEGQSAVMTWMRDELGPEHHRGDARVVGSFALDGRGRESLSGESATG